MTTTELTDRICSLIADALDIDPADVRGAGDLDSLEGWDSLRKLNVMLSLEETFDVVLDPEDIELLNQVDRIAARVSERLGP